MYTYIYNVPHTTYIQHTTIPHTEYQKSNTITHIPHAHTTYTSDKIKKMSSTLVANINMN